jgi:hypothetical protein
MIADALDLARRSFGVLRGDQHGRIIPVVAAGQPGGVYYPIVIGRAHGMGEVGVG